MAVIFISSHQSGEAIEEGVLVWVQTILPFLKDLNFAHFISYFILALTVYFALGSKWMNIRGKLLCVMICLLYGITDEFHQSFIPGRTPDLMDLVNDVIGAALAMLFVKIKPVHQFFVRIAEGKKY